MSAGVPLELLAPAPPKPGDLWWERGTDNYWRYDGQVWTPISSLMSTAEKLP